VLVVNAETPFRSTRDLIERATTNPDSLSYASWGQGSLNHLATAMLSKMTGASMVHVPYKGSAPAVADVVAGHVPLMFAAPMTVEKHIKAGKLRALFVTSAKRLPMLPDVPTATEIGLPEMLISGWVGFVAPAGTPRPIIERLHAEFDRAVHSAALASVFEREGIEPMNGTPEQFGMFMRSEIARWRAVVKESGFTPES